MSDRKELWLFSMNRDELITQKVLRWVIAVVVASLLLWSLFWYFGRHATVVIQYNVPEANSVIVSVDDAFVEPVSTTKTTATYHLKPGEHQLAMKLDGYQTITTKIRGSNGEKFVVNGRLILNQSKKITSLIDINGLTQSDAKINSIKYFYDDTWAVLNITPKGTDPGWLVVSYNAQDRAWVAELGPATSYYDYQLDQLPDYVGTYLDNSLAGGYQRGGHD